MKKTIPAILACAVMAFIHPAVTRAQDTTTPASASATTMRVTGKTITVSETMKTGAMNMTNTANSMVEALAYAEKTGQSVENAAYGLNLIVRLQMKPVEPAVETLPPEATLIAQAMRTLESSVRETAEKGILTDHLIADVAINAIPQEDTAASAAASAAASEAAREATRVEKTMNLMKTTINTAQALADLMQAATSLVEVSFFDPMTNAEVTTVIPPPQTGADGRTTWPIDAEKIQWYLYLQLLGDAPSDYADADEWRQILAASPLTDIELACAQAAFDQWKQAIAEYYPDLAANLNSYNGYNITSINPLDSQHITVGVGLTLSPSDPAYTTTQVTTFIDIASGNVTGVTGAIPAPGVALPVISGSGSIQGGVPNLTIDTGAADKAVITGGTFTGPSGVTGTVTK